MLIYEKLTNPILISDPQNVFVCIYVYVHVSIGVYDYVPKGFYSHV